MIMLVLRMFSATANTHYILQRFGHSIRLGLCMVLASLSTAEADISHALTRVPETTQCKTDNMLQVGKACRLGGRPEIALAQEQRGRAKVHTELRMSTNSTGYDWMRNVASLKDESVHQGCYQGNRSNDSIGGNLDALCEVPIRAARAIWFPPTFVGNSRFAVGSVPSRAVAFVQDAISSFVSSCVFPHVLCNCLYVIRRVTKC